MNLDQYDDTNNEYLEKLADAGFVLEKRANVEELDDKDFAVIIESKNKRERKFPICDKEASILSSMYYLKNKDKMPEEVRKTARAFINEASMKFDFNPPEDIDEARNRDSNVVHLEQKLSDDDFGLVIERDGDKIRKFPLHDKKHVEKAIEHFPEQKDRLTPEQAESLQAKIKEKAQKFGIIKPEKEASINDNLIRDMEFRVRNLPKEAQEPYLKLAEKVKEGNAKVKTASQVMRKLDHQNNMKVGYMKDVFESSGDFTFNVKEASMSVPEKINRILNDDEMKEDLIDKLEGQFEKGLITDLRENPEVLYNSLPEPHQQIIKDFVEEIGG